MLCENCGEETVGTKNYATHAKYLSISCHLYATPGTPMRKKSEIERVLKILDKGNLSEEEEIMVWTLRWVLNEVEDNKS